MKAKTIMTRNPLQIQKKYNQVVKISKVKIIQKKFPLIIKKMVQLIMKMRVTMAK